jgi:hypothetical protein
MARQLVFFAYDEAKDAGPYDERPMLPSNIDLQVHMSRNDRRQPFFLVCQHDSVLVTMSGTGEVEYKDAPVLRQSYELGDFIYVPAGTPHRIAPGTESIHLRYKLPESDREGVAWFCDGCGRELHRVVWDLREVPAQEGYLHACTAFNADISLRSCKSCGAVHPAIDLEGYRWEAIADEQRSGAPVAAKQQPQLHG